LDYLVKPVQDADLVRAIDKIERTRALPARDVSAQATALVERVEAALRALRDPVERIAARVGDKYTLVDLAGVTHFRAETKATMAVTEAGEALEIDATLADLELRLGARFVRIHRALLVSLAHVQDVDARPQGGVWVRLRGAARTELPVARDRVRELKTKIGV
jgi:DNA-binding LytR/AlgR family response regulator